MTKTDETDNKGQPDEAKPAPQKPEQGKAARGEETKAPDWKKPGYNGPITGEIAAFRNRAFDVQGGKVVCRDGFEIDGKTGAAVPAKGKQDK